MFFDHRAAVSVIFSTLTTLAAPFAATASAPACDTPRFLAAEDQVRQAEGHLAETHCYRLDLSVPGLLALNVASADALPSAATVSVRPATPSRGKARAFQTIGRNAEEHLLLATAGTYLVEVRSEDPRRALPSYRLASRFLGLDSGETDGEIEIEPELSETDGEIEIEPELSETDGEIEIEPELLRGHRVLDAEGSETDGEIEIEPELSETDGEIEIEPELLRGHRILDAEGSETDGEIEIEPELSETDGEIEIEPELSFGRIAENAELIDALLVRLCQTGSTDDHADFLACATPLAHHAAATLDNGWGDDTDTFHFDVATWRTVEITTEGIDTIGTLYDRHGQRLAIDDDAGDADGFRLVRTLAPGSYYVKVEGAESGLYTLRVETLDR